MRITAFHTNLKNLISVKLLKFIDGKKVKLVVTIKFFESYVKFRSNNPYLFPNLKKIFKIHFGNGKKYKSRYEAYFTRAYFQVRSLSV
jgi:hypothetical protein